jgi:hypothetical protein
MTSPQQAKEIGRRHFDLLDGRYRNLGKPGRHLMTYLSGQPEKEDDVTKTNRKYIRWRPSTEKKVEDDATCTVGQEGNTQ